MRELFIRGIIQIDSDGIYTYRIHIGANIKREIFRQIYLQPFPSLFLYSVRGNQCSLLGACKVPCICRGIKFSVLMQFYI